MLIPSLLNVKEGIQNFSPKFTFSIRKITFWTCLFE